MRGSIAALLLLAASAQAGEAVKIPPSAKTVHLQGEIAFPLEMKFTAELLQHEDEPGPYYLVVESEGGYTEAGRHIITVMEALKSAGQRFICFVDKGGAHSMAFNILSHCDERYAHPKARFLVHKTRYLEFRGYMMTAERLRAAADHIADDDKAFDPVNAAAMHLSSKDFDRYADQETTWSAKTLIKRGYLKGYVNFYASPNQFVGPPAPERR